MIQWVGCCVFVRYPLFYEVCFTNTVYRLVTLRVDDIDDMWVL